MSFCYKVKNVAEPYSAEPYGFDPYKYSGSRQYATHFGNLCYLTFIANHSGTSFSEKKQANEEMLIAKRKMKYWERIAIVQKEEHLIPDLCNQEKHKWQMKI